MVIDVVGEVVTDVILQGKGMSIHLLMLLILLGVPPVSMTL